MTSTLMSTNPESTRDVSEADLVRASFAQERIWFLEQLTEGRAGYVIFGALRLCGQLDTAKLQASVNTVVARHEALRTTFHHIDGALWQAIWPASAAQFEHVLLHDHLDTPQVLEQFGRALCTSNWDLSAGPLVRIQVVTTETAEHLLLLALHHVVGDGWSLGVLAREIMAFYSGDGTDQGQLPELEIQYADYAHWQREEFDGDAQDRSLEFWRNHLGRAPNLELPTDFARPTRPGYDGKSVNLSVSTDLTRRLRSFGQEQGATLFMTLLCAFQVWLARIAQQSDIVIGTPVAGRSRPEFEPLVGMFVNTVPIRKKRLGWAASFRDALGQTKEESLSALSHQDFPFERLVGELQPARDTGRNPIFQVLFALQNAPLAPFELPGLVVELLDAPTFGAKLDLSLSLRETRDGGITGFFEYSTDLFESETVAKWVRSFVVLLEEVTKAPDAPVGDLPLVAPQDAAWLVDASQGPRALRGDWIHAAIAKTASTTPDAVAVSDADGDLTYSALITKARQLAHHLHAQGVAVGDVVGVHMQRSTSLPVALLAVLEAGCAYLPLDPSLPPERLRFMRRDAGADVVIGDADIGAVFLGQPRVLVDLASAERMLSEQPTSALDVAVHGDLPFNVLYTSGSTGQPKGVVNTHIGMRNVVAYVVEAFSMGRADRVLQKTPFNFDVAAWELFSPLVVGGQLVMARPEGHRDSEYVAQQLEQERITLTSFVPSMLQAFMEMAVSPSCLGSVRHLLIAGEQLTPSLVKRYFGRHDTPLENLYGPTEASVYVTHEQVRANETTVTIGKPLANTQILVLDDHLREVAPGSVGTIYIGGHPLATGYLGRPGLTAERFVPHPWLPGARLYNTGDLGRWRNDGRLDFLGRRDGQIKLRGNRVEVGEIEWSLEQHADVERGLVMAREMSGDIHLVGYVKAHPGTTVDTGQLQVWLESRLPSYMVPRWFVALEELPLLPSGKVDRQSLPDPSADAEAIGQGGRTPSGEVEETIASLFSQLLGREVLDADASFFELGGHSLLATQLVSRLRSSFDVELPLRSLFEGPTVGRLGERIRELRKGPSEQLPAVMPSDELVLSPGQERLWFIQQLSPASVAYNMTATFRLHGELDARALDAALCEVTARHDVLRTGIGERGGRPFLEVHAAPSTLLIHEDVSALDDAERAAALASIVQLEGRTPFDLSSDLMIRARLTRLASDEHLLTLTMHHIASDGWSVAVMVRELVSLYESHRRGVESELAPLSIQYRDYANWLRNWLTDDLMGDQLSYWETQLVGAPSLELPTDHARPGEVSGQGSALPVCVPASVAQRLLKVGHEHNATLFMTLLAGFVLLLSKHSAHDDLVVGTPVAGRRRAELEPLVGFFVNTLALRIRIDQDWTFGQLLEHVRDVCLGAYSHQDVGFDRLVDRLQPDRDTSRTPIFQAMLVLNDAEPEAISLPGLTIETVDAEVATAKFDITLSLRRSGVGLSGALEYSTDLFEPSSVRRLVQHFEYLLQEVARQSTMPLRMLSLVGEAEDAELVQNSRGAARMLPAEYAHELVAARAQAHPDAPAAILDNVALTYGELLARSNQLAHAVIGRGLPYESVVGVMTDRGLDLPCALLGVLSGGHTYLPIDPSLPDERIKEMLVTACVGLLLVNAAESERAAKFGRDWLCLDAEEVNRLPTTSPDVVLSPDQAAYLVFTSGSTGRPKGVVNTHRGLRNFYHAAQAAAKVVPADRVLMKSPVGFDASVMELVWTLGSGACLVVVPPNDQRDPTRMVALAKASGVTCSFFVPSLLEAMLDASNGGELRGLRLLMVGAEATHAALRDRVQTQLPDSRLINLYGPSEATVFATYHEVGRDEQSRVVPIGRPIINGEIYIFDAHLSLCPVGVPGEIFIGGDGVGRGYCANPASTAAQFIPSPMGNGARLYATGDLGRWRDDGSIEFYGRRDHQVKIRGNRVELGDIESALGRYENVRESVVVTRGEGSGILLVAYVLPTSGHHVSGVELQDKLRRSLPPYMIPAEVMVLSDFPRTSTGKVDRARLPSPTSETANESSTPNGAAPRDAVEAAVAAIFEEVLGRQVLNREASFFELGGHSLLATQVVSRLRTSFDVELPLRSMFEGPSVAHLAELVRTAQRGPSEQLPPVVPSTELVLSPGQERLWFIQQLSPASVSYNMTATFRLKGELDAAALDRALCDVAERHEVLRTAIVERDGRPHLNVHEAPTNLLVTTDLEHLAGSEQAAMLARHLREEGQKPFDLSSDLMLRGQLLRLDSTHHVLVLTLHHVASDGWSVNVLAQEVCSLYESHRTGVASALKPLTIQYRDYAHWLRSWLTDELLAGQLEYWKRQLEGAQALQLPTDHSRPVDATGRGASVPVALSASITERLLTLARDHNATLFMTLLAGFALLLNKYSGQGDVVVGSPLAGRRRAELESLIGFFVNTLALRVQIDRTWDFGRLLDHVREVCLGAYSHQDVGFDRLVEHLQPERDTRRSPIFQAMLVLNDLGPSEMALPGVTFEMLDSEVATAKFDVTLSLRHHEGKLIGALEYSTELFDPETVERWARSFVELMSSATSTPDRPVEALSHMTSEDVAWRRQTSVGPQLDGVQWIHAAIAATASAAPDSVAVSDDDGDLTYGRLINEARQMAHHLRAQGVKPGDIVGVHLPRSTKLSIALLAVIEAGGAYLPLDPSLPVERLRFMREDAGVEVVIGDTGSQSVFSADARLLVDVTHTQEMLSALPTSALGVEVVASSPFSVLYTSGSTGRPKGVLNTHGGVSNIVSTIVQKFSMGPSDRVLQKTPINFDVAAWELFCPLVSGGRVVMAKPDGHRDSEYIAQQLQAQRITLTSFVPSMLQAFLESAVSPSCLQTVRHLLVAGEALSPGLVERYYERYQVPLENLYGPTEASVYVTHDAVTAGGTVTIGKPLANTEILILDEQLVEVPTGAVGTIYIGGRPLASGYLRRPGLTAERFVPHPQSTGARLYNTGDAGRLLNDGRIEFLGRQDLQIKLRGNRVELGEIEWNLEQHRAVDRAVVLAREDVAGDVRLVGYVTVCSESEVLAGQLRTWLEPRIPSYMVPSTIVVMEDLPMLPSGKVDRQALPAPSAQTPHGVPAVRPPAGETELAVAKLFTDLLGRETLDAELSFFELGGHSLLATQLVSRLRTKFDVELPLRSVFESPTVARLGELIQQLQQRSSKQLPPVVPSEALVLSPGQERLWFIQQLAPSNVTYNMSAVFAIRGELNCPAMDAALCEVVARHEVLRTRIMVRDGRPYLDVQPAPATLLGKMDLRTLPSSQRPIELAECIRSEGQTPFDLSTDLMLRARLLRVEDHEHVLLLTMHHVASDGWSIGVIAQEVAQLYQGYCDGRPSNLRPLDIQYRDYAHWLRTWLTDELLEGQLKYWEAHLLGAPSLELPTDHLRPAEMSGRGSSMRVSLSSALTDRLLSLGHEHKATLFMTLLAGFALLLSKYSGHNDVVVGSPVAGRRRSELEPLVGFFVNTLPLRIQIDASRTFAQLLEHVRDVCLGGYGHQDVGFDKLVEHLHPERDPSRSPIFQAMLVLNDGGGGAVSMPGLTIDALDAEVATSKFDVTLSLQRDARGLSGVVEYSTDLFEPKSIADLISHLVQLLENASSQPAQPVSHLSMMGEAERAQMLELSSGVTRLLPTEYLHELVAGRARQHPDACAAMMGGTRMTYGDLLDRSNQLAHAVLARKLGREAVVGVMADRGLHLPCAFLGVLASGATYLPIDPSLPDIRIKEMLAAAGVELMLVEASEAARAQKFGPQVLCLDTEELASLPICSPNVPVDADQAAFLVFTSGSTGRPKGAVNTHRGLRNMLPAGQAVAEVFPTDRVLMKAPVGFDASIMEIAWTLGAGACLVIVAAGDQRDPSRMVELMQATDVTCSFFVPSLLEAVLDASSGAELKHLRLVKVGAEATHASLRDRVHQQLPDAQLVNFYGPSETTIFTLATPLDREDRSSSVPIGRPVVNNKIYILDPHLSLVPVGVPGEIYVGGEGVGRGYWGDPARTATQFIPSPWDKGVRLYATGDVGRWRGDGSIEFGGRRDHQIKVRGNRVELGEIESALSRIETVRECVVVARGAGAGVLIVAYALTTDESETTGVDLRNRLRRELPPYMIPAEVMVLPEFPRTSTGKVDRAQLPSTSASTAAQTPRGSAPRDSVEATVATIFGQVLGREVHDVELSFFEMGGHSLLATQLASRLRANFGVEVPLRILFEASTTAALAEWLRGAEATASLPPLLPGKKDDELVLSYNQERLWFLDRLFPGSSAYNLGVAVRLRGKLYPELIQQSFEAVVLRHEPLRMTFPAVDGSPTGRAVATKFALKIEDLENLPKEQRDKTARQLVKEVVSGAFDLSEGPLIRGCLIRVDEDEHILSYCVHHIVADGWSLNILAREIVVTHEALVRGADAGLPALPVTYSDFARWQREWLAAGEGERQLEFWKAHLAGAPEASSLPLDFMRPPVQQFEGGDLERRTSELGGKLVRFSRQTAASPFMVLFAAFGMLLARQAGQDEVVIGTPMASRPHVDVENLIGFFMNTLALRLDVNQGPTFRELVARAKSVCLDAYRHQDVPFEQVLERVQPTRDLSLTPLFQVFLNMLNFDDSSPMPDIDVELFEVDTVGSKFDLTLYMQLNTDDSLSIRYSFNRKLFRQERIEDLAAQFEQLLAKALAEPDKRMSSLSLVTPAATLVLPSPQAALSHTWNGSVPALFRQHAQSQPGARCISAANRALSYGEVDAASNALATDLQRKGAGPGKRVALLLRRSPELVISLLAVLKVGASFVILDARYPTERLGQYLHLSKPCVVVALGALEEARKDVMHIVAEQNCETITLGEDATSTFIARGEDFQLFELGPADEAYISFTSGTTGTPKGIRGRHGSLTHFTPWQASHFSLSSRDCYSALSGVSHDPLHRDLFTPLQTGASIAVPDEALMGDAVALARWLREQQVTVSHLTPAMCQLICESVGTAAPVESLRWAFFVGEKLRRRDVLRFRQLAPNSKCVNYFGSTETQRAVSFHVVEDEPTAEVIPIGRGMPDVQLVILNEAGKLAGIGEVGEITVRSPHIALGYLDDAALTEARFRRNAFTEDEDDRAYHTGDLGRYRLDGSAEMMGRADRQVKVRGFRIELGEIESVLGMDPEVRDVVVVEDIHGASQTTRLNAYVVPNRPELHINELRERLRAKLPDYMVPARIVTIDRIPLTPNGKVDQGALPRPNAELPVNVETGPTSELESIIAEEWSKALELAPVPLNANFFDLGGHSLLLSKLHVRLERRLSMDLPLVSFFQFPTIRSFAAALSATKPDTKSVDDGSDRGERRRKAARRRKPKGR